MDVPRDLAGAAPARPAWYAHLVAGERAFAAGDFEGMIRSFIEGTLGFERDWTARSPIRRWVLFLDPALWQAVVNAYLLLAQAAGRHRPRSDAGGVDLSGAMRDAAFSWIEWALELGWRETAEVKLACPANEPLREDPRWSSVQSRACGPAHEVPAWVAPFQAAELWRVAGNYPARVKACMTALAEYLETVGRLSPAEAAELHADPDMRRALASAYYHCACGLATSAVGDAAIVSDAAQIDPARMTQNRDQAFVFLRKAVELGWREIAAAQADPHLASLRNDPRWGKLWGTWN